MQSLLKKIEGTAKKQLVLPKGRKPADEITRYRRWLKQESHRLKIEHRGGADGLTICRARSHVLDLLLRHLWEATKSNLSPQAQREFPQLSLVSLGGYGRAELSPQSDIDFMFLHNRSVVASGVAHPYLAKMIDGVLYPLWDLGFKVGHSVRNLNDCVSAAGDNQTRTSLIESRLIVGDERLFERFQSTVLDRCVAGHEEAYVRLRLEDQTSRRSKFGDSACMQEPNIKNGCGGLRDFQNLLWMSFFKYRTRSLKDLEAKEFLSAAERKQLERAYDYLLRVRTEMHYLTNRPVDVLSKAIQPAVAGNLGFHDRSPSRRIEHFMREVYTHTRAIYLNTRTLERRMALVPGPQGTFSLKRLLPRGKTRLGDPVDGFHFVNGEIRAASKRVFRDQPRRMMRVFLHAQQRGLELHPDLAQMIRNQLSLVNRSFQSDEHISETFLTILNQRGNVAPILRTMHDVDFLGKYIPEFGKLTCLVQHEFYHQYAADAHTLMCLEQADRIWEGKGALQEDYGNAFQQLEHPYLLYLALLLHDVGKTDGSRGHAAAGARAAAKVARRLGLEGSSIETLEILVAHHLDMAATSQRRDLEDPAVIEAFAQRMGNLNNLNMLAILTFADSLATSDKLWNGFKNSLLWTLYSKAARIMRGGTEFIMAEARRRELLHDEVCERVSKRISEREVKSHFRKMSERYLRLHAAEEIVEDMELAHRFKRHVGEGNPLTPAFSKHHDKDRGCTVVKVCSWDRGGLFGNIAGCLSAVGLNILTAQIFTRTDGIVFDTFSIVDGITGALAKTEDVERFEKLLERLLTGKKVNLEDLINRQKSARTPYQAYTGEQIHTEVRIDNHSSDTRTVIEVETEDHVGLLHQLSHTLHELELYISAALICTEKGGVIDIFYVREYDGKKLTSKTRQQQVVTELKQAAESLGKRK